MEAVTLHLHLAAGMALERFAQQSPVRLERLHVALAAELLQQAGRALDIGEQQGHGAARQLSHRYHYRAQRRSRQERECRHRDGKSVAWVNDAAVETS